MWYSVGFVDSVDIAGHELALALLESGLFEHSVRWYWTVLHLKAVLDGTGQCFI